MGFPVNILGYCLECGGGGITPHHNWCSHHGEKFEWQKAADDKSAFERGHTAGREDRESEIERLTWMLMTICEESRGTWTHLGTHDVLADLEGRWAEREDGS